MSINICAPFGEEPFPLYHDERCRVETNARTSSAKLKSGQTGKISSHGDAGLFARKALPKSWQAWKRGKSCGQLGFFYTSNLAVQSKQWSIIADVQEFTLLHGPFEDST